MNKLEVKGKLKDNKLPEGWTKNIIANLFFLGRGRVISEKEIVNNEGIYSVFSSQTSNKGELGKITSYDFEGEHITWTTDGANAGTVFYRSGRFNCTNVCGTLKARSENIYVKFFAYLLSTQAKKYVSYIGNPKLMNNTVAKILLFFPSFLPEQKKIAKILETVDEAIEKTNAIIEKCKRIKQGLIQDLLTRGIDENGQIRSEETHKFKDSPLGRIPEEWGVVKLKDVLEYKQPYNYIVEGTKYEETGIPVLTAGKSFVLGYTNENEGIYSDVPVIIFDDFTTDSKFVNFPFKVKSSAMKFLKEKNKEEVVLKYIFESMQLIKYPSIGGDHKRRWISEFQNICIPLPPFPEQHHIVSVLSQIDETVEKEQKYKQKLERIKQGLMEDLLTGKVRVFNVN
ncbi:restriction endonuclease subunit S [Candidatus Atribacteria bacterium HGW-Atribacteria-1]|nr:MAG: restriction endonuclease subunit S [Candidatus Atribacteria bacterium HGW-Atribacteria-1]